MSYTTEQEGVLWQAEKDLRRTGNPSLATRVAIAKAEGRPFNEIQELIHGEAVKDVTPEVPIMEIPPHPAFTGNKGTNAAWRAFAKQVSDMDPEVIDSMGRSDIVTILGDKGIITPPE